MNWNPDPYKLGDEDKKYLTDIEIKKVIQLQEQMKRVAFEHERLELEVKVLKIYEMAMERYEATNKKSFWDLLNAEEKKKVDTLTDKIKSTRNFSEGVRFEAEVYRIYLRGVIRNSDFHFLKEVEKYLGMLEECETKREEQILSSIIRDLLYAGC